MAHRHRDFPVMAFAAGRALPYVLDDLHGYALV